MIVNLYLDLIFIINDNCRPYTKLNDKCNDSNFHFVNFKDAELNTYVICIKRILSQKKFANEFTKYIQFSSFLNGNLVSKYFCLGKEPRVSAFQKYIN